MKGLRNEGLRCLSVNNILIIARRLERKPESSNILQRNEQWVKTGAMKERWDGWEDDNDVGCRSNRKYSGKCWSEVIWRKFCVREHDRFEEVRITIGMRKSKRNRIRKVVAMERKVNRTRTKETCWEKGARPRKFMKVMDVDNVEKLSGWRKADQEGGDEGEREIKVELQRHGKGKRMKEK